MEKSTLPTVKHGGVPVIFSGCFSASRGLECIKGMMRSEDYQGVLEWNVLPSVRKLGLRKRFWDF